MKVFHWIVHGKDYWTVLWLAHAMGRTDVRKLTHIKQVDYDVPGDVMAQDERRLVAGHLSHYIIDLVESHAEHHHCAQDQYHDAIIIVHLHEFHVFLQKNAYVYILKYLINHNPFYFSRTLFVIINVTSWTSRECPRATSTKSRALRTHILILIHFLFSDLHLTLFSFTYLGLRCRAFPNERLFT